MKLNFFIFITISTLLISAKLTYADEYVFCNTCVTFSDFESSAKSQLINQNKFIGNVYVGNPSKLTAIGLNIKKVDYKPPGFIEDRNVGDIHNLQVTQIPVPIDFMKKLKELNSKIPIFSRSAIDVPIDSGLESAWDIAQSAQNTTKLDDWYNANHPVSYYFTHITSILGSVILPFSTFHQLEKVFKFSDGSKLIMIPASANSSSLRFKYVQGSSSDIDGNIIPDNVFHMSGSLTFDNADNMNSFFEKASQYGITISGIIDCSNICRVVITNM